MKLKVFLWVGQGVVSDERGQMRKFCGFSFKELLARGRIEKQVADRNRSPRGKARFLHLEDSSSCNLENSPTRLFWGASLQGNTTNRCNGRQCLPPKS